VHCYEFPFIILTSNEDRDFPPAFQRRCLRYTMQQPDPDQLRDIVADYFKLGRQAMNSYEGLIEKFLSLRNRKEVTTDQLFQAIYLLRLNADIGELTENDQLDSLAKVLLQPIAELQSP
jgi:hypothetical protein